VKKARAALDALERKIRSLRGDLPNAPAEDRDLIMEEIRRIREEDVPPAVTALDVAQVPLALCRVCGQTHLGHPLAVEASPLLVGSHQS